MASLDGLGESAPWARLFSVRLEGEGDDMPPVLGAYAVESGGVRFRPRFPFAAGLTYRSRFDGAALDDPSLTAELVFTMPEPDPPEPPRVLAIHPSGTEVPENLLRVYVHFSAPMRAKDVHRYVHLHDAEGREVPLPFVEIDSGLWDPEGRRLTLFFHPGRIKRGVGPNVVLGPPLRAGGIFRIVVDRGMKDERGYELEEAFTKELRVGPADRLSPDPSSWKLGAPSHATAPLEVEFDEALDRALLLRFLRVEREGGGVVEGTATPGADETRWSFSPRAPWSKGRYRLVVNPALEDLAGNTPRYLFDETRSLSAREPAAAEELKIWFTVS